MFWWQPPPLGPLVRYLCRECWEHLSLHWLPRKRYVKWTQHASRHVRDRYLTKGPCSDNKFVPMTTLQFHHSNDRFATWPPQTCNLFKRQSPIFMFRTGNRWWESAHCVQLYYLHVKHGNSQICEVWIMYNYLFCPQVDDKKKWSCIKHACVLHLTHWGLVMPYGDTGLGQHWLR